MALDKRFKKRVAGMFGKYNFEVGVLEDGPHKNPRRGKPGLGGADVLKTFAGGPARKVTNQSDKMISQVSTSFRSNLGINYLTKPFEKRSLDRAKFTNEFFKLVFAMSKTKKRVENLLQAVVRNPILRGDYGTNSGLTQKIKGFNRFGIDTAQLFKALKAKCNVRGGSNV